MIPILDIILVALVVLIAFLAARRGLILTILDLVSGIVAFVLGKMLATPVAEFFYKSFFRQKVLDFLTEKFDNIEGSIADAIENISSVFKFLPEGVYTYVKQSGLINSDEAAESLMERISSVSQLEQNVVSPVMTALIGMFCFVIISGIILIALRLISVPVSKLLTKSKIADSLNTVLGGVFGVVKGLIYAFIIAIVICVVSFANKAVAEYAANSFICEMAANLLGL